MEPTSLPVATLSKVSLLGCIESGILLSLSKASSSLESTSTNGVFKKKSSSCFASMVSYVHVIFSTCLSLHCFLLSVC